MCGCSGTEGIRPVIQLDAPSEFWPRVSMAGQNIQDNGCLGIIMFGGFHLTSLPGNSWYGSGHNQIRETRVHGIIRAKPVHLRTTAETAGPSDLKNQKNGLWMS